MGFYSCFQYLSSKLDVAVQYSGNVTLCYHDSPRACEPGLLLLNLLIPIYGKVPWSGLEKSEFHVASTDKPHPSVGVDVGFLLSHVPS